MRKPVNRRTHSEREKQIIEIASRSFRDRGFEGVSLSDLAREAGVTRNLVYHYFPNKGALFEAVLDHRAELLLERLPEPAQRTQPVSKCNSPVIRAVLF